MDDIEQKRYNSDVHNLAVRTWNGVCPMTTLAQQVSDPGRVNYMRKWNEGRIHLNRGRTR